MDYVFLICALSIMAVFLVVTSIESLHRKKMQHLRIRNSFGKPPEKGFAKGQTADVWEALQQLTPAQTYVDDLTWADLGMEDVYARINACQSAIGADWLYAALHVLQSPETLGARSALQDIFAREEAVRFAVQNRFANLGCSGSGYALFLSQPECAMLPYPMLYRICAVLPWCFLPLLPFGFVPALGFIGAICVNIILSTRTKFKIGSYLPALGYVAALLAAAQHVAKEIRDTAPQLADDLTEALAPFKSISGALMRATSAPAVGDAGVFADAFGMVTLLPVLYYQRAVQLLVREPAAFLRLCEVLGEIELAIAAVSFRESVPGWCTPEFSSETTQHLECEEVYHPLIAQPVKNSDAFSRSTLFTGSNASGKSTFLKALAVNAILAQTLHLCTAERFRLSRVPVITSMAVSDDLLAGDSYFIAEIKSLQRIVAWADTGAPCLCFVDEILKGTNTIERIAASCAVLRHLAATRCLLFVATHDIELTRILNSVCDNRHFTETVSDEGVSFDYRLRPGPSTTRNAIALLHTLGFTHDITQSANSLANAFDSSGQWPATR